MPSVSRAIEKTWAAAGRRLFRPAIAVESGGALIRLGSGYGGWTLEDAPDLRGSLAVTCGLGEDASFDVEFAARYGADVVIVDPTPRSVAHYRLLSARIGLPATTGYVAGGDQPPEAYDLSEVKPGQLHLEEKALWIDEQPVRFHKPSDPRHVSHSIKFKSGADDEAQSIVVPATTLASILRRHADRRFSLLKMDIEGAEIDILDSIADWPALPSQILVEFDVLRKPGRQSKADVEAADALLRRRGYACRHYDGDRNYLYVRDAA